MTTWRIEIQAEMEAHNEDWNCVESIAGEEFLDLEFDDGFGGVCGQPFTVWTQNRVYFPKEYDGAEGCISVSRNPDGLPTEHK